MLGRALLVASPFVFGLAILAACAAGNASVIDQELANTTHVRLIALNDFHGNLAPPAGASGTVPARLDDPLVAQLGEDGGVRIDPAGFATIPAGGAAYLAAHVKRLRAERANTLVVSAGDLSGASPLLSNLFRDEPTISR